MIRKPVPAPPSADTTAARLAAAEAAIDDALRLTAKVLATEGRDRKLADVVLDVRNVLVPPVRDGAR